MTEENLTEMDHGLIYLQDAKDSMNIACDKLSGTLNNEWDKTYILNAQVLLNSHFNYLQKLMNELNLFIKSRGEDDER